MNSRLKSVLLGAIALASLVVCVLCMAAWFLRASGTDAWTWQSTDPPIAGARPQERIWQIVFGGGSITFIRETGDSSHAPFPYRKTIWTDRFKHEVGLPGKETNIGSYWFLNPAFFTPGQYSSKVWGHGDLGVAYWKDSAQRRGGFITVSPLWLVIAVFAVPAAAWEWRVRFRPMIDRRKLRRRGLCAHCGYDLRASRERCPECGMPIVARAR